MTDAGLRSQFEHFRAHADEADLLDAALLVARCDRPGFDPDGVATAFAAMEPGARSWVPASAAPRVQAEGLCTFLGDVCGFRGDPGHYQDPDSSRIDKVLATGCGIPITLAVVYVELGRRLGLDCVGVNFPGHFLVRVRGPRREAGEALLIDPYAGRVVTHRECEALLQVFQGEQATLEPKHLQTATPMGVLVRMLTNLKQFALGEDRPDDALRWSGRILMAQPDLILEHRDRALLHERAGRVGPAIEELELLAAGLDDEAMVRRVRERIERLRARPDADRVVH